MTEAIGAITSGVTSNFQQKSGAELEKIQQLKANNSFDKFDKDGDGKISGTDHSALKVVLSGIDIEVEAEGAIDESAFNAGFTNAEYEAK